MNAQQFATILPQADAVKWLVVLNAAMVEFFINTPPRQAAFLANLAVESNQLRTVEENLNYSAQGLADTWPSHYATVAHTPTPRAVSLARNPEAIANNVYADRMGNGSEASGDGWKYRGSGPIQLTGKDNQLAAAKAFGIDPDHIGEWLRTPEGGCRSAARFWMVAGCDLYADAKDFDGVCDCINKGRKTKAIGDAIGYADRAKFYATACKILGV